MLKLKRAVWSYVVLRCVPLRQCCGVQDALVLWILQMTGSGRLVGLLAIGSGGRVQLADWAVRELFDLDKDFDEVLHILGGDEFFERNKKDVLRLERTTGRRVIDLWDTDPIFAKYPHLRTLARNREFEIMWAKMKQRAK